METAPMALPEYVTLVLTLVGTSGLAYAMGRSLFHAVRAVVLLLASVIAMKKTIDENRRRACLAIVDKVTRGRDIDPPSLDHGTRALVGMGPRDDDSGKTPPSLPKP
jgi:hypothetical protein